MWHCLYLLCTLRVGVQGLEEYPESSVCHIWQVQVSFPAVAQQQSQVAATSDV